LRGTARRGETPGDGGEVRQERAVCGARSPRSQREELRMLPKLTWSDAEEIGIQLFERLPHVDPIHVRFTDLHKWVCELEGFADDPQASTEGKLEAIQMAWLDAWREEND
jgi:FeS assembly protein IscX